MPAFSNRTNFRLAIIAVIFAGMLAGIWGWHDAHRRRLAAVDGDAMRCALAIYPGELSQLTATHADENTAAYGQIKRRLTKLNDAHPHVQRIRLFRQNPETGALVCLADSEPADSPRALRPGDPFPGQINAADVLTTLRTGRITFNEKQADSTGRWMSVYAPVESPGDTRDIMRLDAEPGIWHAALLEEAVMRALYVWLLLGALVATYVLVRRRARRKFPIHKLNVDMEQSATPMMLVSAGGIMEYVNQGLCALSRFDREELIGQVWIGKSRAMPRANVIKVGHFALEGKTWTEDFELERKGGERYPAKVTSIPVRDADGGIAAYITVIVDMTETQRRTRELHLAKERAETADRAKSVFLATMSHEVRTPLNGIVGFSDLLLDTELTREQREYVLAIHTSGETLMQLTSDILDYSRIESGRVELTGAPCELRDLIEDALDMVASRAAGKTLQFLHDIDPALPEYIIADGGRLRQVLVNLLDNAIKFTRSGEVEVSARVAPPGAQDSDLPSEPPPSVAGADDDAATAATVAGAVNADATNAATVAGGADAATDAATTDAADANAVATNAATDAVTNAAAATAATNADAADTANVAAAAATNAVTDADAANAAANADAAKPAIQTGTLMIGFTVRDTGIGIAPEDQTRLFQPFVQLDSSSSRRYGGVGLGLVISRDLVRLMGGRINVTSEPGKGTLFSFTVRCAVGKDNSAASAARQRLAGKRIAVISTHPGLRRELERELARAGATVIPLQLSRLGEAGWDMAIVDCPPAILPGLRERMASPGRWHAARMIGLIGVEIDGQQRKLLRPCFRMLLGKPLRHRMLIDQLSKNIDAPVPPAQLP
ncbi:MAG: PAS domain S-box protein [Opitutaceae bacterium]|jgi:PAS domain S-box-containing protein|nr:PAS domain S-box protein [Opitutaceae bacterium]